jgi:hypothetical protein
MIRERMARDSTNSAVAQVAEAIRKADMNLGGNGEAPKVTALPVWLSKGLILPSPFPSEREAAYDRKRLPPPSRVPLFRVGRSGKSQFVDGQGNIYETIEDWRANNRLAGGVVTFPRMGT